MADQKEKIVKASMKNLNIAPRKVRLVANLIKGQSAMSAIGQLQVLPKRSSDDLIKLIRSALANAQDQNLDTRKLIVDNITVNKGKTLKRGLSGGRGRVTVIRKMQSHIDLTLKESNKVVSPAYTIPARPKKVKEFTPRSDAKEKPKFKEEDIKRDKKKSGFMKRIFQRKAV